MTGVSLGAASDLRIASSGSTCAGFLCMSYCRMTILSVICGRLLSSAVRELGAGELPGGGGELCTWICTRVAECQGS